MCDYHSQPQSDIPSAGKRLQERNEIEENPVSNESNSVAINLALLIQDKESRMNNQLSGINQINKRVGLFEKLDDECRFSSDCQEKNTSTNRETARNRFTTTYFEHQFNESRKKQDCALHCTMFKSKDEPTCERFRTKNSEHDSPFRLVNVKNKIPNRILRTFSEKIFMLFVINSILSQPRQIHHHKFSSNFEQHLASKCLMPQIFALAQETATIDHCNEDYDCKDGERFCHENKCICPRERPIEDKERSVCLPLALINEACFTDNQCLSDAKCIDGFCACTSDYISWYNPSTKVYYCHPKRRLNEDCNYDAQCPENAFCSTKKRGCLCQNGYGAAILKNNSIETVECLPKTCKLSTDCESDHHICDENKCKCLATHFDPHTALCYKFGSTGGNPDGSHDDTNTANATNLPESDHGNDIRSILKDLTMNGDRMWLVILALILLTLILLVFMIFIGRRYCLGYCWTVHKKEYEPNNKNSARSEQHLDKNSINNKSFRRKKNELDDDDSADVDEAFDNTAAERSNLMTTTAATDKSNGRQAGKNISLHPFKSGTNNSRWGANHSVEVDMSNSCSNQDNDPEYRSANNHHYQPFNQVLKQPPIASSTSTPV